MQSKNKKTGGLVGGVEKRRLEIVPYDSRWRLIFQTHETKRRLAAQFWPDMNAYAEAKTEIIENIIAAARTAGESSG